MINIVKQNQIIQSNTIWDSRSNNAKQMLSNPPHIIYF